MRKWIVWVVIVGLVILLGVWGASRLLSNGRAEQPLQLSVKASPLVPTTLPGMEEKLMDPAVDLPARESLIEKIDIQKRLTENEKAGQASPAPKDPVPQPAAAAAMESSQVETGIFEGSEGMVRPEQAKINNYWRGLVDGKVYMLMAGSTAADSEQGLVVLVVASLDPTDSAVNFSYYNSPSRIGSLRVESMIDDSVMLQASGGVSYRFDLKTLAFVK